MNEPTLAARDAAGSTRPGRKLLALLTVIGCALGVTLWAVASATAAPGLPQFSVPAGPAGAFDATGAGPIVGLTAGIAGPAQNSPVAPFLAPAEASQVITDVAIRDDYFEPKTITVTVGSVVRWTNRGQRVHSSTSDNGYWNWSLVPGASFGLRFLSPGTYNYHCLYHRAMGMTGTVVVTGSSPLPTPTPGPAPSVNADTIVFDYYPDEAVRGRTDLLLVQPDGSNLHPLTRTPELAEAQPSWSPDKRQVAYTASTLNTSGSSWGLWVMDVASGQRRQITAGPEHYEPDWRPDQSLIVFTNIGRSGGIPTMSEIAVISPNGGYYRPLARVISSSYGMVNPTWSPDGQRIAFSLSSSQTGGELYTMNANGSNIQRVYAHPGWDDIDPEWSPDGRYLAFSSGLVTPGVAQRHDIWLLDLTTGLAGMVAQQPEWELRRPAWSPDGSQLVFTARYQLEPPRWALYIVPAVGGTVSGPIASGVEPDWGAGALLPAVTPEPLPTGTPPEPPTPLPFPTIPPPEPTPTGPAPTFPPPEPTPTSMATVATATAVASATATTVSTPFSTPSVVRGKVFLPITWKR